MKKLIFVLIWLFFIIPCQARIITVNWDGSGDYLTIQAAINDANHGDIIEVLPGTYTGDGNRDIDYNGKAITVRSIDPNDPNIVAATIIDCDGTELEPHRGFYFHNAEEPNSILAGVTIMNGYAEDGGGVYCESSSPTLRKCNFTRNLAQAFEDCSGGGMYNYRSSPTLLDCTFSGNSAFALFHGGGSGGGMHNSDSSPTLTNCTFENNSTAWAGGGMRNSYYSTPTLSNCTFGGNSADDCGGGMDNDYHSNPTLTNCTFSGNSAAHGGGIHNDRVSPMLTNCSFSGNSASYSGGGMENYNDKYNQCSPTLINCTFANNRATMDGGGISNSRSNPTLTNCTLSGNSADHGAGMYIYFGGKPILTNCLLIGNTASNFGGGISAIHNSSLELNNCTFALNSATNGNALACYHRHQQHLPSDVQITNCILWDGGNEIWNNNGSEFTIRYSDVQDGWPGDGNIDVAPCFVDLNNGDYHLLPDSPCINAGDPNYIAEPNETDLDGRPRVIGGRIDMGAFEYSPPIPAEARIVPRTINLASKGKWITCYIWLPEDYNVADIDPNSILLENEIKAESLRVDEQQQVAIAKFSRSEVQGILNIGEVELSIIGWLTDRTLFEGRDVIRVINKEGGGKPDKYVQASDPNPPDGVTVVDINADLSWVSGPYVTSHDVYFGTSSLPPFVCNQTDTTFDPGTMADNTKYYWRIDEVNKWGKTIGEVWSFTIMLFPPPPPPPPPP